MKKISVFLCAVFFVFLSGYAFAGDPKTLTLLYTGDMAGNLKPVPQ